MASSLLQKLLAELRASRSLAKTDHERRAIDGAMADLVDGIMASGDIPGVAPTQDQPIERAASLHVTERPMSKLSPFYGIGLKEACPKLLHIHGERTGKVPLSPREIWEQLKAEGWTSNHHDPAHSVNDALRRRAQTHHDVMLVGSGKWGRTDWYTDAELEEIGKSMGGMGGRDRGDHIERTKAGMALAKSRGARLGATKKLSDEQGQQILDAARAGGTKEQIAKQFGISTASVTNYVKRQGYNSVRELRAEGKKLRAGAADTSEESEPGGTRH
jgi:transposase